MPRSTKDCSLESALRQGGNAYIPRWEALPRCTDCGRPMRGTGDTVEEWPATVTRANGENCMTCYYRPRGGGVRPNKVAGGNGGYGRAAGMPRSVAGMAQGSSAGRASSRGGGRSYGREELARRERASELAAKTRAEWASEWSPEQRSVALLVAERVPLHPEDGTESLVDVLGMLGMWSERRFAFSSIVDPGEPQFGIKAPGRKKSKRVFVDDEEYEEES